MDAARDFSGSETVLDDTIVVDNVIIHLSKPSECITSNVNCNANCGLWIIIICQHWFISYKKCTTLIQDVMAGEAG